MYERDLIAFIDLERTIIPDWENRFLINAQSIRKFLKDRQISEIGIFSFAIYNEDDKRDFESNIKPMIETALDVNVVQWPSVIDMIRINTTNWNPRMANVGEFIKTNTKDNAFSRYVQKTCQFKTAILIDDMVSDLTIEHRHKHWVIELWNVDSLS